MPASATTPELQPLRCRFAAYSKWAMVADRPAATAPARAAFLGQFDAYPNPEAARKAYFTKLSLASAMARATSKTKNNTQRESGLGGADDTGQTAS